MPKGKSQLRGSVGRSLFRMARRLPKRPTATKKSNRP
jgi:hypothetical protein